MFGKNVIPIRPGRPGRTGLMVVASIVVMAAFAAASVNTCEAEDQTVNWKPVNWQTLDPHGVARRYPTDAGGGYPKDWISTPPKPVVVRQDHPDGPTYQEALGYEFLIYNFKFARMARMADGTIVLRGVDYGHVDAAYNRGGPAVVWKMFSSDDGDSWHGLVKDTVTEPWRGQLVSLGGQELMLYGHTIHFSKDGGKTWDQSVQVPAPKGGYPWANKGTILVERDNVKVIQFVYDMPVGREPGDNTKSVLHVSHDRYWASLKL